MKLTRAQVESLYNLYKRSPYEKQPYGYLRLRRTVRRELAYPKTAIVPNFCGMVVGIEPDGHVHS